METQNQQPYKPDPVAAQVQQITEQVDKLAVDTPAQKKKPLVLIVLGMAGSGKTTFTNKLTSFLAEQGKRTYNINLDPAVLNVSFHANIDIRDSVKYKEVMKKYQLEPNGAILTSLNIFAAQFDQVVQLIEQRQDQLE